MKALNNPWFVSALAVTAVTLMGYQVLQPKWPHRRIAGPATASAPGQRPDTSASTATTKSSSAENASHVQPPIVSMDTDYLEAHINTWAEAPKRDPFRLIAAKPIEKLAVPFPVPTWKLNAIWQQQGSPMVAINRKVYREGDVVEGYKIVRIEDAQIWFQGPDGPESLGFGKRTPRVAGIQKPAAESALNTKHE